MSEIPTSEKVSLFLALQTEHDDCGSGQHNCDENAICTNTVQGHSCTCKPGYVGNGTICRAPYSSLFLHMPATFRSEAVCLGSPTPPPHSSPSGVYSSLCHPQRLNLIILPEIDL
ncbi:hypothetical protein K5549_007795 [Capra hircus]|nr:hypothetical protein K5549_007795 [Capra hircus]